MKKVLIFLVLLGILAMAVAGCSSTATQGGANQTTGAAAAQTGKPVSGGTLKMISGMGPQAFGYPPASGPLDSAGYFGILEPLITPDKVGEPLPVLATSWETAADGKSITFKLRKGVKFHDGTDFNASAVKWNIDMDIKAKLIMTVSSLDIVDDYTVKFNLPQFNNAAFTQIADMVYISPTAVDKNGVDWAKVNAIGTGPFKQGEFKRDVSFTKPKFEGYWDKGKPYLDSITHIFIPDQTTARMSFLAGEAQVLAMTNGAMAGKDARQLADQGISVRGMPGMANFLTTDSKNQDSPFSNIKVRQALEYAIDKKAICDTLGFGYMQAQNQIIPVDMVGFNPNIKDRPFDQAKAKQLLTEAGYASGFKTKLMAIQGFTNPDVVTAVKTYLGNVGIDATIDMMDMGRGFQTLAQGWNNGISMNGTGVDPNMCQRLSADLGAMSPFYPTMYKPPQWQTTLDQAMAARDTKGRDQALQQLMQVAVDEMFVVPLWVGFDLAALDKKVNCDMLQTHHIKWTPSNAWLSK